MSVPLVYEIVHHDTRGMYYVGSPTYSLVPHDPSRADRRVIVNAKQPRLRQEDIGRLFVRAFSHQTTDRAVYTAPFDGIDHSYIPSRPTEEACQEVMMRLKQIAEDGTLRFEREKQAGWNPYGCKELIPLTLEPKWNDAYWMPPELYLNYCRRPNS